MSYHAFGLDGDSYGSFEVFYDDGTEYVTDEDGSVSVRDRGFYWWACYPGCLPDSDATGPFKSEEDAIDDARDE